MWNLGYFQGRPGIEHLPAMNDVIGRRNEAHIVAFHRTPPRIRDSFPEIRVSRLHAQRIAMPGERFCSRHTTVFIDVRQWIEIEQRPDRVEVVQDLDRRQTRFQTVQAMADQRRNHEATHTEAGDEFPEHARVLAMRLDRACDLWRQRNFANQTMADITGKQFQSPSADFSRQVTIGYQYQVHAVTIAGNEVLYPSPDTATPTMCDMQCYWQIRFTSRDGKCSGQPQSAKSEAQLTKRHRHRVGIRTHGLPQWLFRIEGKRFVDQPCRSTLQHGGAVASLSGTDKQAIRLIRGGNAFPSRVGTPVNQPVRMRGNVMLRPCGEWIEVVGEIARKNCNVRQISGPYQSTQHRQRLRQSHTRAQYQCGRLRMAFCQ